MDKVTSIKIYAGVLDEPHKLIAEINRRPFLGWEFYNAKGEKIGGMNLLRLALETLGIERV